MRSTPNLSDLSDVVVEADLGELRARAFRDGMIAYDFTAWGDVDPTTDHGLEIAGRRVRVINAHMALLGAVSEHFHRLSVANNGTIMRVTYEDGEFQSGAGLNGRVTLALFLARTERQQQRGDWTLLRLETNISSSELDRSFTWLRELLGREEPEVSLLRAELLLRAGAAYFDLDYSGSLAYSWTCIESLLGNLLSNYISDAESWTTGSSDYPKFITSKRRDFLLGSQFTAAHAMELLSFAGRLPFDLYRSVGRARVARNQWLHTQQPLDHNQAIEAIRSARALFALVECIPLVH